MTQHPFDILDMDQNISLIFTPCPGTKEANLSDALNTLKDAGAHGVITLMPEEEMAKFNAQSLPQECDARDLKWFHLPIQDDSVPEELFKRLFDQQKADIFALLKENKKIAIHCRGGSGRTGFMAAILLLELNLAWQSVKPAIQALRPKALTKQAQLDYLHTTYQINS